MSLKQLRSRLNFDRLIEPVKRVANALLAVAIAWAGVAHAKRVFKTFAGATVDDAGITYAYADSIANGLGPRLTAGDFPTEGFSNFLQVLLLLPFASAHADLDLASKWMNIGATAVGLAAVAACVAWQLPLLLRPLALLIFVLPWGWPAFEYWTAQGLEGGLLMGLQCLSLCTLWRQGSIKHSWLWLGIFAGMLAWTRPEAAMYGACATLPLFLVHRRSWWRTCAVFVALVLLLLVVRWILFRDLVPNTYWAKMGTGDEWRRGLKYIKHFFGLSWPYFLCILPIVAFSSKTTLVAAGAGLAQLALVFLFAISAGGDWMHAGRFIQPAYGPLLVLHGLGLVALVEHARQFRQRGFAVSLVLAPMVPVALYLVVPPSLVDRAATITRVVDAPFLGVAGRAPALEDIGRRLGLQRNLVSGEDDIGGVSYRTKVRVVDFVGLADRTIAKGLHAQPAGISDYLFGELRPDFFHLHGPWLSNTRFRDHWALTAEYRVQTYSSNGLIEAIRNDLTDPLMPPALRTEALLPGVHVFGVTAIATGSGYYVYVHGQQVGEQEPAAASWSSCGVPEAGAKPGGCRDGGRKWPIQWHNGFPCRPLAQGSSLLGRAVVEAKELPLMLDGTPIKLERWPVAEPAGGLLDRLRHATFLLVLDKTRPCSSKGMLDEAQPEAAQIRGAAFVSELCRGLAPDEDRVWYQRAHAFMTSNAPDAERFLVARAAMSFFSSKTAGHREVLDQGRRSGPAYDQVAMRLAGQELMQLTAEGKARAAALYLAAGDVTRALTIIAAYGLEDELSRKVRCTAVKDLALLAKELPSTWKCEGSALYRPHRVVQSMEAAGKDESLKFLGGFGSKHITRRGPPKQGRVVGGQGLLMLNSFDEETGDELKGEVIWEPGTAVGQIFGALVGGGDGTASTYLVAEVEEAGAWTELGRIVPPGKSEILVPMVLQLSRQPQGRVRVRIVDNAVGPWGHLMVDGISFVDLNDQADADPRPTSK